MHDVGVAALSALSLVTLGCEPERAVEQGQIGVRVVSSNLPDDLVIPTEYRGLHLADLDPPPEPGGRIRSMTQC
jgi:hypothetical protein